ncbi:hypothetical protein QQF64_028576, partial [Cirrhinus molitorella]
ETAVGPIKHSETRSSLIQRKFEKLFSQRFDPRGRSQSRNLLSVMTGGLTPKAAPNYPRSYCVRGPGLPSHLEMFSS